MKTRIDASAWRFFTSELAFLSLFPIVYCLTPSVADQMFVQGKWKLVSVVSNGMSKDVDESEDGNVIEIRNNKFILYGGATGEIVGDGQVEFARNSSPSALTITHNSGFWGGIPYDFIYKIEDVLLVLCHGPISNVRPDTFESSPSNSNYVGKYKRID